MGGPILTMKHRNFGLCLRVTDVWGPLEGRAWAWQERYCSVRFISFASTEAKWHCRVAETCECLGEMRTRSSVRATWPTLKDLDDEGKVLPWKWKEAVQVYSGRELSYQTDRLPAISGIASHFHSLLHSKYIAGLWEAELPFNLGWFCVNYRNTNDRLLPIPPPMDNGVPTWSWASTVGLTCFLWEKYIDLIPDKPAKPPRTSHVSVVQVNCNPKASNLFGEVQPGSFIELRGHVVEAEMEADAYRIACVRKDGFSPQRVWPDCQVTSVQVLNEAGEFNHMQRNSNFDSENCRQKYQRGQSPSWRIRGTVYCLLLFSATLQGESKACVLILGKVPNSSPTCYQRIGIGCGKAEQWGAPDFPYGGSALRPMWPDCEHVEQWEAWEQWFEDAKLETVRIV